MSRTSSKKSINDSLGGSTINQKAALASAYQELGKELSSAKLKAVGNYTLQRVIGEGTYGKVRLGMHRLTNTRVAIKQVPKTHSASLTREIHHHRRLHHPNVMKLYEIIATEQYIWMVSELCAGGELYDYLVEREILPEPEARRIFGQLCLAVAYVHDKGIVHRDLKLENVLLDERCNVKLGDFGFTREFEGKKLMDTFCGTTGYAAPEMLAGKRYTGEEVDVWSLGIILYALLCGALPFDDDDENVMKNKILKGDLEIPDCLSQEAQGLVKDILKLDPAKRPTIKVILDHPWFSKIIVSMVEEDTVSGDYFHHKAETAAAPSVLVEGVSPRTSPKIELTVPEPLHLDKGAEAAVELAAPSPASTAAFTAMESLNSGGASSDSQQVSHKASVSSMSESSFYSACSDNESSGRRSSTTDITDPSTGDVMPKRGSHEEKPSSPIKPSVTPSPSHTERIGIHRNESQTTIKRAGSNGSDASWNTTARNTSLSASTSLPTHHELPLHGEVEESAPASPATRASTLVKRGSQNSSRGHHRTPSRTKRRSVSSSGLSDHHPPPLANRPIDYVAQLTHLQPAIFSTVVEQNLLHQLSSMGIDVGQLVHSIVTDACDASGALWWLLVKKAQERETSDTYSPLAVPAPHIAAMTAASTAIPPPVPQKDPSRQSQDRTWSSISASSSSSALRSRDEPLGGRLHTVISQDELDAELGRQALTSTFTTDSKKSSSMGASETLVLSTSMSSLPATDRSTSSTPDNRKAKARPKHRHTATTLVISSREPSSPTSTASPDLSKSKHRPTERSRSNSLSMKQFASTVLGTREKPPQLEPVCIAGETLPFERAKSPSIFGKRNASGAMKEGKESSSLTGKLSAPSTPKKTGAEYPSPEKVKKSMCKKSVDTDLQRVKVQDRRDSGNSSPARGEDDRGTPSASVDSFSTMSLTPQTSEKGGKQRPGSSFMATVRTWLGANEKPNGKQKQKSGKKVGKPGLSGLGYESSVVGSPTSTRTASMRRRSGHYQQASISRRGPKSPQLGSLSRRSSTGSSKQFMTDMSPAPHTSYGRPPNLRRMSAGSITPTATVYGDYMQDHHASRSSRPSSSHSHQHVGLHGKSGSVSSASSARRLQSGSSYSSASGRRHAHRLSYDGATTVRRHRQYGSSGSPTHRNSRPGSLHSRNSSPSRALDELDDFGRRSGISTPRRSLESEQSHHHHSIFVAHKSRSPYKPPSANPSLQTTLSRLPSAGTCTWRHSWGRPPPSWAGAVDPPPSTPDQPPPPKLRDVFANKEDEDWTDDEDEPAYSGGLGQVDSSSWISGPTSFGTRYAGVRSIFQPPSLGNEFAPKILAVDSRTQSAGPGFKGKDIIEEEEEDE